MLLTLALVVLTASIIVFFSAEFIGIFKKIFAIPGAKIFVPAALASWLVYQFNYLFLWSIYYCREVLQGILFFITHHHPFQNVSLSIVLIVFITGLTIGPVILLDIMSRKNTFKPYRYPYLTSTLIWLVVVMLLIIM